MEILRNHGVQIEDEVITDIPNLTNLNYMNYDGDVIVLNDLTMLPGFVQTHVHLCQTLFRGLADDMQLLEWLSSRIFPYENSHSKDSLKYSAQLCLLYPEMHPINFLFLPAFPLPALPERKD